MKGFITKLLLRVLKPKTTAEKHRELRKTTIPRVQQQDRTRRKPPRM